MSKKDKLYLKYAELKAGLGQVSRYYIAPNKKSTSTEPGTSNEVLVNWKKRRMEELAEELEEIETLIEEE